jgi:hypothetical protein
MVDLEKKWYDQFFKSILEKKMSQRGWGGDNDLNGSH